MNITDFNCNLCHCKTGKTIPFRYSFKDKFLNGVKCDNCELLSIWPRPTDLEIEEMYAEEYFTVADSKNHHMEVDYLQILNAGDYAEGVNEIKKHIDKGDILEIGCATGNFLNALQKSGYQTVGIEISKYACDFGTKNFGIKMINKPFSEELLGKELQENQFDLVLMGDVLEHFTNPTEAMTLVNKILKPSGVALIQVPGTLSLLSSKLAFIFYRLIGSQKTMYIPPYHLTEFTEKTAKNLLSKTGFSKVVIEQHIKHPSTITLRGNFLENIAKKYFQYINLYLTKWFGIMGDRIHIEAYK